jgi:hypothetical protein
MSKRTPSSLVAVLFPEAYQAEESAVSHCGREAERLGDVPPGLVMRAITEHAKGALPRLRELTEARGMTAASAGTAIGRLFSNMRDLGTDVVVSQEKSYRGTLLGVHHGVDTFLLLEDAAIAAADQELADFCHEWIAERARLVAEVERDLEWFAANPNAAMKRAMPAFVRRVSRSLPLPASLRSRAA